MRMIDSSRLRDAAVCDDGRVNTQEGPLTRLKARDDHESLKLYCRKPEAPRVISDGLGEGANSSGRAGAILRAIGGGAGTGGSEFRGLPTKP